MPIALIAGVVIVIIGAVGFVVTRDASAPEELTGVEDALPANDGPEPITEDSVDEGELSADAAPEETLPAPTTEENSPVVSGLSPELQGEEEAAGGFVDGTYTAPASYFTPNNTEHNMEISLTVAGGVVSDVAVVYDGGSARTPNHQRFDAAIGADVVGVALEDVNVSRVGGASLTSEAFNEAVDTIKQQAAA